MNRVNNPALVLFAMICIVLFVIASQ